MAYIIYPGLVPRNPPPEKPGRGKRLVREVIREGRWLIGDDPSADSNYLNATAEMVVTICESAVERAAAGILAPLQWDHNPDNRLHTDDSQKVIDYFEEFWTETHAHGVSLWAGFYPGSRLNELAELKLPVSPHIQWNVADGTGKVWPIALAHVALVDHATIPGQSGFVAMALPGSTESQNMDIAQVIELLNKVLGIVKPGLAIPDTVTDPEQLSAFLDMAMSVAGGQAKPAKPDAGTDPALALSLKSLRANIAGLAKEVKSFGNQNTRKRVTSRQPNEWDTLVSGGYLTPEQAARQLTRLG